MAQTDAGGMFFKVSAIVDKTSFEQSQRSVGDLDVSFKKLIGTVRNAGVVLAAMKGIQYVSGIGEVETQAYRTATALGISTDAFKLWSASAKIAGVNADSLFASMEKVGSVLTKLSINGAGSKELSEKLGVMLGLGLKDLQNADGSWMSADKAFEVIIQRAEKMIAEGRDLSDVYLRLKESIGSEGADFFAELQREGVSLDEFQRGAQRKILTDADSDKKSQDFAKEVRELKTSLGELKKVFDSELAGALTPTLQSLNDWLDANGTTIKDALTTIALGLGNTAGAGVTTVGAMGAIKDYLKAPKGSKEQADALAKLRQYRSQFENNPLTGWIVDLLDKSEDNKVTKARQKEDINHIYDLYKKNKKQKLKYNELSYTDKLVVDDYISTGGTGHLQFVEMQDGIMRPDGTITKVAPDDWVFAARNVSDMARAFIPQNYTAGVGGNAEYSIVQNFTINGGNDMPQILRQQAYRGTQEGLLEIMNQSSRRLQLMSGTR